MNMSNDILNLVEIREFEDECGNQTGSELINLSQEIEILQESLSANRKLVKDSANTNNKDMENDFDRGQALIDKLRESLLLENGDEIVFDVLNDI